MTLTNYWWLLLWMFTGAAFLAIFVEKREEIVLGKREIRWTPVAAVAAVLPYIVWAGNRSSGFGDTGAYRKIFYDLPSTLGQIPEYLADHSKDKGFSVLMIVVKSVIGNRPEIFFFLVAAFQMLCIVHLYRKFSSHYWLCLFMFVVSTDYLSWAFNGMRQFLAVTIILCSFKYIIEQRYLPAILIILLASTIHGSAFLMIPFIFLVQGKAWNMKTVSLLVLTMVVVISIDKFTPLLGHLLEDTQYSGMVTDEIWTTDDGTNALRVLFYSIPAILSLVGKRFVDEKNDKVLNVTVNLAAINSILYILSMFTSGIYIGRLPIYATLFGYMCVPEIIELMFTKKSTYVVYGGLVMGFIAFFYIQLHFGWGIL